MFSLVNVLLIMAFQVASSVFFMLHALFYVFFSIFAGKKKEIWQV